jgi:O-antigen/teichoic acid export membrane protein
MIYWGDIIRNGSELLSFSLSAFLTGLLIFPLAWGCNVLLVNQPAGYNEAALFNAANQWKILIIFLPTSLIGAFMPILSDLKTQNDRYRFRRVLLFTIQFSSAVAVIVALGLILMARPILGIYGEEFLAGQMVLFIVALTGIIESFTTIMGQTMISAGAIWPYLYRYLVCVIGIGAFAIVLVPVYLSLGLAVAYCIGQAVLAVCLATYWSRLEYSIERKDDQYVVPLGRDGV